MFPDSAYSYRHPITNNPKITDVLDIAENEGIELFFPKGFYYQGKFIILVGCEKANHTVRRKEKITDVEIVITENVA